MKYIEMKLKSIESLKVIAYKQYMNKQYNDYCITNMIIKDKVKDNDFYNLYNIKNYNVLGDKLLSLK